MAQTNLNFATQKSSSTSGGTTTGTGSQGGSNAPDTGYLTIEETSNASANGLGSFISQPAVSGTFIFIGFLLLLGFIAKIYKNKQNKAFRANSGKKVFTTQILGFASLLMMFAGIGGAIARHVSSDAITGDPDAITTSGNVTASVIDTGSDYKLYCATDTVTIKESTENGYLLYAEANNGGSLVSSNASISSIQDWSTLANNTWGFYTDKETYTEITEDGKYKPIHTGSGVIAYSYEPTAAGEQVKVNYCTKVGLDTEANYTSTITYGLIALDSENIAFVDGIDYDSTEDYDEDGLSNRKESQYGTNVSVNDSDLDGVADGREVNTYGTDPLATDTDNDGLDDYNEITFDFNPRKADTNGDGINDGERTILYTVDDEDHGISFDITGTGNLASSYIEVDGDTVSDGSDSPFSLYSLNTTGNISSATITMSYDVDDLNEAVGETITEDELVIAAYDAEADKLQTITTTIDKTKSTLTATITDPSLQYIIADKDEEDDDTIIEDVVGSANDTEDESDDEDLRDTQGGILKKIVKKAVSSIKKVNLKTATDCLTSSTGCDSGFRASKDGFAFANFQIDADGGECQGMAALAVLNYTGHLNTSISGNTDVFKNSKGSLYSATNNSDLLKISGSLTSSTLNALPSSAKNLAIAIADAQDYFNTDAMKEYRLADENQDTTLYSYTSNGQPAVVGITPLVAYDWIIPSFGGHSIVIESFKKALTVDIAKLFNISNSTASIKFYTAKIYNDNYPNTDGNTLIACSNTIGTCFIYPLSVSKATSNIPIIGTVIVTAGSFYDTVNAYYQQ